MHDFEGSSKKLMLASYQDGKGHASPDILTRSAKLHNLGLLGGNLTRVLGFGAWGLFGV